MLRYLFGFFVCFAIFTLASSASASLLVADGFGYPTPGNLAGNADTNYPTNPATWNLTGTADPISVVAGNLTYTGTGAVPHLPGTNSISMSDSSATEADRINLGTPVSTHTYSQSADAGTSLYYSFTLQATSLTGITTGAAGTFIAGFNNSTGSSGSVLTLNAGALCVKKGTGTTFELGVAQNAAANADRIYDTASNFSANDPIFAVVEYDFGATAGTDTAELYLYDSATNDTIPGTKPASATVSSPYSAEINSNPSQDNLESFFLRTISGSPTLNVDDVRVGTTWGDVTSLPEPTSLALLGLMAPFALRRRRVA